MRDGFFNKKSRHERYKVRDNVVEMTGPDKASLVSLFFNYMSLLLRKTWTMQVQVLLKIQRAKIDTTKIYSKKLTITARNRVVAKQSRCEGVYNRTGDLSVSCFGKEERRRK